jgi:hypothetical protein
MSSAAPVSDKFRTMQLLCGAIEFDRAALEHPTSISFAIFIHKRRPFFSAFMAAFR